MASSIIRANRQWLAGRRMGYLALNWIAAFCNLPLHLNKPLSSVYSPNSSVQSQHLQQPHPGHRAKYESVGEHYAHHQDQDPSVSGMRAEHTTVR